MEPIPGGKARGEGSVTTKKFQQVQQLIAGLMQNVEARRGVA